ncbi:MAG: UDP-glucose/GDP-mannose dehydrogenase family protein [Mesorhizobium sp.]|nr:UDP-glucose/GDP-mannose dehydrogenase family protein [Mesorhizobium sp.]
MKLVIVGTGYVGLVAGGCLSDFGHDVVCIDTNAEKIALLRAGQVPMYEPGLDAVLARNVAAGRLGFSTELASPVAGAKVVFVAVDTPNLPDGGVDMSRLVATMQDIARALTGYTVVVTKSTVPIGANRKLAAAMREARPDAQFDIVSNPEFLREGVAVTDFMQPDRVVIGLESERARAVMDEIYQPLALRDVPVLYTGLESAEMIKYAANAFLATKVSFINDIAALCERVGADVKSVADGIGLDPRVGDRFLHPGPGYGGSCFPKDTDALVRIGRESGAPQRIVEAVIGVNHDVKLRMVGKILDLCGGSVDGKTIAVLGVTFKPDTDDMRDAPSLVIVPALAAAGASIRVVDPEGRRQGAALLPQADWFADAYAAADGADALVILTEWSVFRTLDLARLARSMATPAMADLRNIYQRADAIGAGFSAYVAVGR